MRISKLIGAMTLAGLMSAAVPAMAQSGDMPMKHHGMHKRMMHHKMMMHHQRHMMRHKMRMMHHRNMHHRMMNNM